MTIDYDKPIGAETFAIADTLTEDGRIGKVTDVQGIVMIKPVMHDRWTPVPKVSCSGRATGCAADARGANATALHSLNKPASSSAQRLLSC